MDFSKRVEPSELPELMDGLCSYEVFRACLLDLERMNRLSLGYRPTLAWLDQLAARVGPGDTLRILDVGCGGGDVLRKVGAWARARGVRVALTGIDLNPYAAQAAREFDSPRDDIEWVTGDAFSFTPAEGVDVVLSSLFVHHLETPEIARFLAWMESTARLGWFVNDLCREPVPYWVYRVVTNMGGWHRFLRYDGPVSFRRSFREEDWLRMLAEAGILADVSLRRWRPGRLCVGRLK
ncbi:MAG: methyltransferase domain-containing protein [Acidobacteriaceae bacterium]